MTARRVRLTQHAVRRYQLRVKPALDLDTCENELRVLSEIGAMQTEEPFRRYGDQIAEVDRLQAPDAYIELAPKIWAVVALDHGCCVLLTVLIDGGLSRPTRRVRNQARRAMREMKQKKRKEGFLKQGSRRTREEKWR